MRPRRIAAQGLREYLENSAVFDYTEFELDADPYDDGPWFEEYDEVKDAAVHLLLEIRTWLLKIETDSE